MREKNSGPGWCAEEVQRTVEMMPAGMAPDSAQSRRVERAANAATGVRARKYRNKLIDAGRWQLSNAAELLAELKGLEFRGPGPLPYLTDDEIKTALVAAAAGKVIGQPMPAQGAPQGQHRGGGARDGHGGERPRPPGAPRERQVLPQVPEEAHLKPGPGGNSKSARSTT
mmetsp:Transcript_33747/g.82964  ORF Transcript_33747/g.82964 Transcript_33747/m.82964 type:complete len:170 (-) Transcript_33747:30-539(-)